MIVMKIYEAKLNDKLLEQLIGMSADWEGENSCHGYRKNERSDIEPNQYSLRYRRMRFWDICLVMHNKRSVQIL